MHVTGQSRFLFSFFLWIFHFSSSFIKSPTRFKLLDRLVSQFIWQNKRARVRLKVLCLHKEKSGLSLAHLRSYYWAAQLRLLVSRMSLDMDTKWVQREQSSVNNVSLSAFPFLKTNAQRKLSIKSTIICIEGNEDSCCLCFPPG